MRQNEHSAKLYKIVVQFAEVSNFSEVPLQSGLNQLKKKNLMESYWPQGKKGEKDPWN